MNNSTNRPVDTRTAGIAGILAAPLVLAAPMTGQQVGPVLWLLGFALALVALAGLAAALRNEPHPRNWLTHLIVPFGAITLTLQLTIMGIGYVANHLSKSSPVHEPLHSVESALFTISLYGLGLALAAAGLAMHRQPGAPKWMTALTGVVAACLVANASALGTEQVPALLAFLVWLPASGIALLRRSRRPLGTPVPIPTTA